MRISASICVALFALMALCQYCEAFVSSKGFQVVQAASRGSAVGQLHMSSKRNTKDEKRMRNRDAARRNRNKGGTTGKARRRIMRLAKINEVKTAEAEFMATAFQQVTEDVEKVNPLAGI